MYVMSKVGLRKHTRKPHTKGKTMRESPKEIPVMDRMCLVS